MPTVDNRVLGFAVLKDLRLVRTGEAEDVCLGATVFVSAWVEEAGTHPATATRTVRRRVVEAVAVIAVVNRTKTKI